jgi:hypothetical protein
MRALLIAVGLVAVLLILLGLFLELLRWLLIVGLVGFVVVVLLGIVEARRAAGRAG